MNNLRSPYRSAGLSLIELMIALVISSLLVLGLVEVFAASRSAYQLSTGLARVQENGRFALDFMQRDIRMAGHLGCVNDQARFLPGNVTPSRPALASTFLTAAQQLAENYAAAPESLRFDVGMQGHDAKIGGGGTATGSGSTITLATVPVKAADATAWEPALSAGLFANLNNPVQNSDVIVLRYFAPTGAQMTAFTPGDPATLNFSVPQSKRLTEGVTNPGLFGITDCMNAAVFQATTTNMAGGSLTVNVDTGVNKSGLLGIQSFVQGQAVIYRAESVVYYVGINADSNPALYRLRYTLTPGAAAPIATNEELVEGVESIQLQYGQDSRTAANEPPTGNIGSSVIASALLPAADPATAWRRVGLVQVGLVARSPEPAAATQAVAPLSALGVTVTPPNDSRYRTVYEDSIALRNRLFGN
ncbi:PilW family protein [Luteimonas sp. MC1825]|uniref:PilW family protein n=1 Tax=Luteimonas sp. MC1825 TaxID=2761107 RepID=UPI001607E04E|nr:PilW family protein [Luteimonas sp. MC1825]MBB6598678.1 PilW family protein [Luteimonas sp. MC1825]QOC88851.1 PilW family protein [Luteimonas sp. MC1825]